MKSSRPLEFSKVSRFIASSVQDGFFGAENCAKQNLKEVEVGVWVEGGGRVWVEGGGVGVGV